MYKMKNLVNYSITDKAFNFSIQIMELYTLLLKNNEFDLADKLLVHSLRIRQEIEESLASEDLKGSMDFISKALNTALSVRFYLKLIQMKYTVNSSCDLCVDSLNEIINILNYISTENNSYSIKMQYQVN